MAFIVKLNHHLINTNKLSSKAKLLGIIKYIIIYLYSKFYIMAKASKPAPPLPKYRDAGSGQYVKPGYAKAHPKTTVKEIDKPKKK